MYYVETGGVCLIFSWPLCVYQWKIQCDLVVYWAYTFFYNSPSDTGSKLTKEITPLLSGYTVSTVCCIMLTVIVWDRVYVYNMGTLYRENLSIRMPLLLLRLQSIVWFMWGMLCFNRVCLCLWHRWRLKAPVSCCCQERGEERAPMGRPRKERGLGKSPDVLWWVSYVHWLSLPMFVQQFLYSLMATLYAYVCSCMNVIYL